MDWMIFATVVGTGITTIGVIFSIMTHFFNGMNSRLDAQGHRTDRLYEMFIDLIKTKGK